jgi:hypothetical protein
MQLCDRAHVERRMQRFLDSGDPILMGEAIAWAQFNPGVLNGNGRSLMEAQQNIERRIPSFLSN